MNESPFVSVIIPTLGRAEYLTRTVSDLHKQSYRNAEIVIVDQSDGPEHPSLADDAGLPILYVRDRGKGLNRSRNIGRLSAKGALLIFVDDDVEIATPHFIDAYVRGFSDPAIGAVCGRSVERREEIRRAAASKPLPRVYPIVCLPVGDVSLQIQDYVGGVKGCNMAFRATALNEIGGFDESFGHPCIYEETDAAMKVIRKGYRILFCPEAFLYHIGAPSGGMRVHDRRAERRFVAYRDRAHLFANNCPMWQFPLFFLGNTILAMLPLTRLKGKEATRSFAGLITGVRRYIFTAQSGQL